MDSKGIRDLMEAYASIYSDLSESHFKVGDEVICKNSGMEGEVVKVDPEEKGKYYTVKREDGKMVKYAPDELKLESEEKEEDENEKDSEEEMEEGVDLFDHILEYLIAEGYADTNEASLAIMANMGEEWKKDIVEGMTMKDFKKQRSRQKQKDKRAAEKTSPLRRAGIHADKASPERAARHRANVDPDFDYGPAADERNYPGGKLRPNKVRKAKALGELGESAEDRARDEHLMRGGMAARKDYDRPPAKKLSNAELGIKPGKTWVQKQMEKKQQEKK